MLHDGCPRNMDASVEVDHPPTLFVIQPSPHLKCPVCAKIYTDPVINIKCGHTFCRQCTFSLTHCPLDSTHCDTSQIVINRLVIGQIEDLQLYCRHGLEKGDDGSWNLGKDLCTEILSLGKRREHEDICQFAMVSCPFSDRCGKVKLKDLADHELQCVEVACDFASNGCNYHGTQESTKKHSRCCFYESGAPEKEHLAAKVTEQEILIAALQDENDQLTKRVVALEDQGLKFKACFENHENIIHQLQQKMENLLSRAEYIPSHQLKKHICASNSSLDTVCGRRRSYSFQSHAAPNPSSNFERWEMPFQFKCIGTLRGHKDVVWAVTTKKGFLYSGGSDGIIKIWSLEQLAKGCVGSIQAHTGVIHCLATWGNNLLSAGADKSIAIWDLNTNTLKSKTKNAHDNIICAQVICDNLMFTSSFAEIKAWDLNTMEMKECMKSMNHWVRALALSKGKETLYSGSHKAINVWDAKSDFKRLGSIDIESGSVYSLAVSKTYIIAGTSGSHDKNIQIFNVETHEFVMNFCGHMGTVTTLVVSPSGQFLFSSSLDNTIQMWGLEKLLPIQTLNRHQGSVNTLTLHGDFLISGSEDHEIKIFRYFRMQ